MDVHEYTYDRESALFGNGVSDIYDNSILREDWVISTLYEFLKRLNLLEKTIVVLASDHGEAFGERGYEGHAREVFPETTETPVIISLPFKLSQGIVLPTRTTNMDIWPTLFDLLGLPAQGTDIDGRSRLEEILALARGETGGRDEDAQAELSVAFLDENWGVPEGERLPAISLVNDEFRYVRGSDWNGRPIETLLSVREGQRDNVIEAHPDEAEALRKKADEILEQEAAFPSEVLELDEMQLDQLRALGYQLP
jgi:arylsulfatase A-like enzyme